LYEKSNTLYANDAKTEQAFACPACGSRRLVHGDARRLQHVLDADRIAPRGVVHKDMGDHMIPTEKHYLREQTILLT